MKIIRQDSALHDKIRQIEEDMDRAGLKIVGQNLRLVTASGDEYRIGRDSDQFPRFIEEPFILEK